MLDDHDPFENVLDDVMYEASDDWSENLGEVGRLLEVARGLRGRIARRNALLLDRAIATAEAFLADQSGDYVAAFEIAQAIGKARQLAGFEKARPTRVSRGPMSWVRDESRALALRAVIAALLEAIEEAAVAVCEPPSLYRRDVGASAASAEVRARNPYRALALRRDAGMSFAL